MRAFISIPFLMLALAWTQVGFAATEAEKRSAIQGAVRSMGLDKVLQEMGKANGARVSDHILVFQVTDADLPAEVTAAVEAAEQQSYEQRFCSDAAYNELMRAGASMGVQVFDKSRKEALRLVVSIDECPASQRP